MRGHHPNDVLKINTPIIHLLRTNPPPSHLLDAVATSLIVAAKQSNLVQSVVAAQSLLARVRENILVPGKVTFLEHRDINTDDPRCVVMLASGDVSVRLLGRVDILTGDAYLSPALDDCDTRPEIVMSIALLQTERKDAARVH